MLAQPPSGGVGTSHPDARVVRFGIELDSGPHAQIAGQRAFPRSALGDADPRAARRARRARLLVRRDPLGCISRQVVNSKRGIAVRMSSDGVRTVASGSAGSGQQAPGRATADGPRVTPGIPPRRAAARGGRRDPFVLCRQASSAVRAELRSLASRDPGQRSRRVLPLVLLPGGPRRPRVPRRRRTSGGARGTGKACRAACRFESRQSKSGDAHRACRDSAFGFPIRRSEHNRGRGNEHAHVRCITSVVRPGERG